MNALTHPALWFGLLRLPGSYWTKLGAAEILVLAVEVPLGVRLLRNRLPPPRAAAAIAAGNVASFLATFAF